MLRKVWNVPGLGYISWLQVVTLLQQHLCLATEMASYYFGPLVSDVEHAFDEAFSTWASKHLPSSQRRLNNGNDSQTSSLAFSPRMDVHESQETNLVTAEFELPGLRKEDITINVHNNRLTISGNANASNELHKEGYVVQERRYGKFSRTVPLPPGTKGDDIKASFDNGVLSVNFPKSTPEQEARRIAIN